MSTRVVLVDDHPLYREGLRHVIESDPEMEIVAEAASCEDAKSKILRHEPDVIVVDLYLGKGSGHAVIEHTKAHLPATRILVVSMSMEEKDVRCAILAGAHGYVSKLAEHQEILLALSQVAAGKRYISSNIVSSVLQSDAVPTITPREEELLALLYEGATPKDCADRMSCTYHTVKAHLRALYRKTQTKNMGQMLLRAQKLGLSPQHNS